MNRREFLKTLMAGAAVAAAPVSLVAIANTAPEPLIAIITDGEWHGITEVALPGKASTYSVDSVKVDSIEGGSIASFENGVLTFDFGGGNRLIQKIDQELPDGYSITYFMKTSGDGFCISGASFSAMIPNKTQTAFIHGQGTKHLDQWAICSNGTVSNNLILRGTITQSKINI